MSLPDALLSPSPLAFQVWDAFGWVGQALFALRMLQQWITSEKARRSHVTPAFWWVSLGATALLLVYVLHRRDPVFVVGFLVNGFLYARNLRLMRRAAPAPPERRIWRPVILGLAVSAVLIFVWLAEKQTFRGPDPGSWLVVGILGQTLWTSRFVVQWVASERRRKSVLPAAFFWISIAGSALLFAYAVVRHDWVMMAAFAFNPIPYARNLILLRGKRQEDAPA